MYNPNSGEHFYTQNMTEANQLFSAGWKSEGVAWQAPTSGDSVWRLYNPNSGEHFYTMTAKERDNLVAAGWKLELGGAAAWKSGGNTPIYRAYNPNAEVGKHNYTTTGSEQTNLVNNGWKDEGTVMYAQNPGWKGYMIAGHPNTIYGSNIKVRTENFGTLTQVVQTDVKVTGSGKGYQGKIMFRGVGEHLGSQVSFGIQYNQSSAMTDSTGTSIGGKLVFLTENISNGGVYATNSGAPVNGTALYTVYGISGAGQTHNLKIAFYQSTHLVVFYLDGQFVGSQYTNMVPDDGATYDNPRQILDPTQTHKIIGRYYNVSLQAAAANNGDSIVATFSNVVRTGGWWGGLTWTCGTNYGLGWLDKNLSVIPADDCTKTNRPPNTTDSFILGGTVSGLAPGEDWDNTTSSNAPQGTMTIAIGTDY